ncbi:MAG TPA: hypothetical protein VHW24_21030 [Bryobacteraceae bacterium]|nr:hypothetical protein [Bryobacteraceae bacterium]
MTAQPVQHAAAPPPASAAPPYAAPQYAAPSAAPYATPYTAGASQAPMPVAAKGGSGLKIVMVVLGLFAVLGIAAIGAVAYIGHRVKQAVIAKADSYGVDLKSIAASGSSTASSSSSAPARKPCDYMSKDEVSRIIGEPVERTVTDDAACQYFGPPGLAAKLGKDGMSTGMQQLQRDKPSNAQLAESLNNLINGMGAQSGDEKPLLLFVIDRDGKAQMTALNIAGSLFGQIPGAKPEEIPGLGDRAVRFANLGLNVMKGNTIIRIVAGPIPDPDNKTTAIARALLPLV